MTSRVTSAVVLLTVLAGAPAGAQESVDVSRLPLNLEKLIRELKQSTVKEERDGLNLRYTIEVFGQAPPIVLINPGENLTTGPVPDSAPTHREMIEHVTPKEYRAPAADFSALLRWLAERAKK
jgi:hypothetical protein